LEEFFVLETRASDDSEYIFPTMRYGDYPIAGEISNTWSQISNSTPADNKKTVTTYIYPSVQLPLSYYVRLRSTDSSVQNKTLIMRSYVSDEQSIQPYHTRFFGEFIAAGDMNFYTITFKDPTVQMLVEVVSLNGNLTIYFQDDGTYPTVAENKNWTNVDTTFDTSQNGSHTFVFLVNPFISTRQMIRLSVANNMTNINTNYNLFAHFFDTQTHTLPLNTIISKTISTGDWHYFIVNVPQDFPTLYIRTDEDFADETEVFFRKDYPPSLLMGTYINWDETSLENNALTGGEREYFIYKNVVKGTYYLGILNNATYTARYSLALSQTSTFPSSSNNATPAPKDYSGIIIGISTGCGVALLMGAAWFIISRRRAAKGSDYQLLDKNN